MVGRFRNMAWPLVIYIGELTEKIPVPVWGVRADLQLAVDIAEENPQCSLGFHE